LLVVRVLEQDWTLTRRGWPDRLVIALEQALIGRTDRTRCATEADISPASATNDLRRLLNAGVVTQQGHGRNTRYHASDTLRDQVVRLIAQAA
jgi:hypothetical protein